MATSSMHKPGWRSRRRSKLSLVERAVPRLGRFPDPDDGQKPPRSKARALPVKTNGNGAPHPIGDNGAKADLTPPPVATSAASASSNATSNAVAPDPETIKERPASTTSPDDLVEAENLQAADADVLARNVDPDLSEGGSEKPPSSDVPIEPDLPVPVTVSSSVSEESRDASIGAGIEKPTVEPSVPLADMAANDAQAAELQGKDTRSPQSHLNLDWQRLVAEGFTDPRNGDRLLSADMKEITRALIRQALSDQSSWRDRVVLVTSANERAAKTAASINFAFSLTAASHHQVVLMDVDTAGKGAVDRLGGGAVGVCTALTDETIDVGDLTISTDLDRLTLVASGEADEDTLDRFASRRMLQILRVLTKNPDTLLIIDAPPILESKEAAVLSVIAGQVVLAVEAGRTTGDSIDHALQRIGDRHNVSLVLTESNGAGGELSASAATADHYEREATGRRTLDLKRRLPKTAAAVAGVAAIALLAMTPPAFFKPAAAFFDPGEALFSTDMALPRLERCLSEAKPIAIHQCRGAR